VETRPRVPSRRSGPGVKKKKRKKKKRKKEELPAEKITISFDQSVINKAKEALAAGVDEEEWEQGVKEAIETLAENINENVQKIVQLRRTLEEELKSRIAEVTVRYDELTSEEKNITKNILKREIKEMVDRARELASDPLKIVSAKGEKTRTLNGFMDKINRVLGYQATQRVGATVRSKIRALISKKQDELFTDEPSEFVSGEIDKSINDIIKDLRISRSKMAEAKRAIEAYKEQKGDEADLEGIAKAAIKAYIGRKDINRSQYKVALKRKLVMLGEYDLEPKDIDELIPD